MNLEMPESLAPFFGIVKDSVNMVIDNEPTDSSRFYGMEDWSFHVEPLYIDEGVGHFSVQVFVWGMVGEHVSTEMLLSLREFEDVTSEQLNDWLTNGILSDAVIRLLEWYVFNFLNGRGINDTFLTQ